ncbi:GntR family transcriptional regulator [Lipingzhangella sp. LS1_29]|uniref:GntR family transcriptional regulator n=1 Tax=Lipingzhangella rawalii TaxID=2055835 RepID=A0ABU2HA10_9ACTN|nr:GntR family transcriptional regulator [Lipingzhangella rawalii]MDS1271429.1 GntR family transcriptional regulator [Lipingzhangella rawalii]
MTAGQPRYVELAEALRRPIVDGELPAGTRLPSRAQLAVRHRVSEQVSRNALRLLAAEGLVESRSGSGYFVRSRPSVHTVARTDRDTGPVSPLPEECVGVATLRASTLEARRLRLREGDLVYQTRCIGRSEGTPILAHTSWEPAVFTHGSHHAPSQAQPQRNPIDRLARVGVIIDQVRENVSVRPAREPEATVLRIAPGQLVIAVERTHYSGQRAVETSDLVAATDRCTLAYRLSLTGQIPAQRPTHE